MIDCACGEVHESNYKMLIDIDEHGKEYYAWALCEEHARHEPCRTCMARDAMDSGYYTYQEALRDGFKRMS